MAENRSHAEFSEKALTAASEATRFADPKLLAVLVFLGLGLSNIITRASSLWHAHDDRSVWGWLATGAFLVAGLFAALVLLFVTAGLFPRTKRQHASGRSLLFFADVASFDSPAAYDAAVRSKSQNELDSYFAHQAWEVARIATRKHHYAKLAYGTVVAFLGAWVLARIALLFAS